MTEPAQLPLNINDHFTALMTVARKCAPHLLSTQSFFKKIIEAQMWASHAIAESAQLETQKTDLRKHAAEIASKGAENKVDIKSE